MSVDRSMSDFDRPSSPRRRPQFSLRTVLLLFVLVAFGTSIWISIRQSRENERLLAENDQLRSQLRNEIGELDITDANRDRLQAIAIPTVEPKTWKWRIYVPPGRRFWINFEIQGVSDSNLPEGGSGCGIGSGEQVLVVALRKDESKGNWTWIVKSGTGMCGPVLPPHLAKWIERPSNLSSNQAGQKRAVIVEPGRPLELLRYRSFPRPEIGGPTSLTGVGDGILVWIREDKTGTGG